MNLNIIGNGFDLFHGLPSSYYYFGCYLIKNDPEFFELIGNMYNISFRRMIGPAIAHEFEYVVEDILWKDFEGYLGEVDEFFVVDSYEDDLGLENNDPVEIKMDEDERAEKLMYYFEQWVMDTLDQKINYKIIKNFMKNQSYNKISKDDYYIVFNYTHILQNIYGVSDRHIYYVHGECKSNKCNELIVGHGNDDRIEELRNKIYRLEKNYDYAQSSNNRINENKCLLSYIERLRKNVSMCMLGCGSYYDTIDEEIDKIVVYGLSLSDVDLPYLEQLRNRWPDSRWEFSFYNDNDKSRIELVAQQHLKLKDIDYSKFYLGSEVANKIKKSIVEEHCIETH